MNRLILLGLAILALAGLAPTHASEVRDSKGRFSLSVPAGWSSQVPENNNEVTVVLAKVDTEAGTGAACLGIYFDMPTTRSASQADLNTVVEGQLTETFWRDALKASGDRPVDLVSRGKRDIDGRRSTMSCPRERSSTAARRAPARERWSCTSFREQCTRSCA